VQVWFEARESQRLTLTTGGGHRRACAGWGGVEQVRVKLFENSVPNSCAGTFEGARCADSGTHLGLRKELGAAERVTVKIR